MSNFRRGYAVPKTAIVPAAPKKAEAFSWNESKPTNSIYGKFVQLKGQGKATNYVFTMAVPLFSDPKVQATFMGLLNQMKAEVFSEELCDKVTQIFRNNAGIVAKVNSMGFEATDMTFVYNNQGPQLKLKKRPQALETESF